MAEKVHRIKNVSKELFLEVIRTLPTHPIRGGFTFLYDNLPWPSKLFSQEDKKIYFIECEDRNLVPYLNQEYSYDKNVGVFIPGKIELAPKGIHSPELDKDDYFLSVLELIEGKKAHRIFIGLSSDSATQSFEGLRENLLPYLKQNGYKLSQGELTLTRSLYNEENSLEFGIRNCSNNKFELDLSKRVDDNDNEKVEKLKEWFSELKNKYDRYEQQEQE